jgi:metal-responsive CopG/Arc/MetJ family transcriptional regulator
MYEEEMQLVHLRIPKSLATDLEDTQHALGRPSIAELVRDALRAYVEGNSAALKAYRRLKERHAD